MSPTADAGDLTIDTAEWVVAPARSGLAALGREVWRYRRLVRFFAVKALEKIYARTKLGWLWLVIRPLFPLAVNSLVFGGMLGVGSDGLPYFLFLVAGTAIWELFAGCLMWGTRSLELNRGLLRQVYLPRLILPISMISPALLSFALYLLVFVGALVWFGVADGRLYLNVTRGFIWAPVAFVMTALLALGITLWTSVPAMVARDVRFTLGYVLGFWVFLTPVLYPLSAVPPAWRPWVVLNPMAPLVETFKYGLLGIGEVVAWQLLVSAAMIAIVFISGLMFFVRAEADAADRV